MHFLSPEHNILNHQVPCNNYLNSSNFEEGEYLLLPSKGYFYQNNIDKLKIKYLTYEEEFILSTDSYFSTNTAYDEVLKNVILDKQFDYTNLVEIDKQAILLWLRIAGFGNEYSIKFICPHCEKKQLVTWNLTTLQTSEYPEKYKDELRQGGSVKVILPKSKAEVLITLPSLKKQREIKELLQFKTSPSVEKLLLSLYQINYKEEKINNVNEIYNWLTKNKIPLSDSRYVQGIFDELQFKIEADKYIVCIDCGEETHIPFTIGNNIFALNSAKYRKQLLDSVQFLVFWGKFDQYSVMKMPISKRNYYIECTHQSLKILYPKPKKK